MVCAVENIRLAQWAKMQKEKSYWKITYLPHQIFHSYVILYFTKDPNFSIFPGKNLE